MDLEQTFGQFAGMDIEKIANSTNAIIVGVIAGGTGLIAVVTYVVTLGLNVSSLERRITALEERTSVATPSPDPVAAACAELAKSRAAADQDLRMTSETEKAMIDLGCLQRN